MSAIQTKTDQNRVHYITDPLHQLAFLNLALDFALSYGDTASIIFKSSKILFLATLVHQHVLYNVCKFRVRAFLHVETIPQS